MPITPEDRARENIDKFLAAAGWIVQNKKAVDLSAGRGVAVREFPMESGYGEADYLLFADSAPNNRLVPRLRPAAARATWRKPSDKPPFNSVPHVA
jgi:hypothetical protein